MERFGTTVALFVVVGLVAGCSSTSRVPQADAAEVYQAALSAVCDASDAARAGDVSRARDSYNVAHEALHALAAETALIDDQAATRLVEFKQVVESGLSSSAPQLPVLLDALTVTTRNALAAATGTVVEECPDLYNSG